MVFSQGSGLMLQNDTHRGEGGLAGLCGAELMPFRSAKTALFLRKRAILCNKKQL